jgi:hypothetical protein
MFNKLSQYLKPRFTDAVKKLDAKGGEFIGKMQSKTDDFFNNKVTPAINNMKAEEARLKAVEPPPLFGSKSTPSTAPIIPTPAPVVETSAPAEPFKFNFEPHIGKNTKRKIYEPPMADQALYNEFFPKEATSAATVAFNESMYNPEAKNLNTKGRLAGTYDRGYFQMNDESVMDLIANYPNTMKKLGVNSFDDWVNGKSEDKRTNFAVAKLYRDKYEDRPGKKAWSSWYGHTDQGFENVGNPNINYNQ